MAHVDFAVGSVFSAGSSYLTLGTAFPLCDLADFSSGIFVSPALPVTIADLVRYFWQVKSWTAVWSSRLSPGTFNATNPDETDVGTNGPTFHDSGCYYFGIGVVINPADGSYGLQSDVNNDGTDGTVPFIFNLTAISGTTLTFTNPAYDPLDPIDNIHTVTLTEDTYWAYA